METPTTPNRYFVKELLSVKVWSTKGYQIPFEDIGDDVGLLITNHPGLLAEIDMALAKNRGGIREISEDEVEEVKKKALVQQMHRNTLSSSRFDQNRAASTRPFSPTPSPPSGAAAVADLAKPVQPGTPLSDVPIIDPALLRPKASRKKSAISSPAPASPVMVPVPQPPPT